MFDHQDNPVTSTSMKSQTENRVKHLSAKKKILVVDDDENIRALFRHKLEYKGFEVDDASSIVEILAKIEAHFYDIILLDNYLSDGEGLGVIKEIIEKTPFSKIVVLTGRSTVEKAISALCDGAAGFLLKSDSFDLNIQKLEDICNTTQRGAFPKNLLENFTNLGLIGTSEKMQKLYSISLKVAYTDSTILLSGESGTGKEIMAQAIHKLSPRGDDGPFIAINCAAISESLLEAELFGSKKGAFTDSRSDRKGYFETCSNGTLLLDEIGEMSMQMQSKLLRVLQEREVTPVGSCQPVKVNTRVIAATNRNLESEVAEGRFRDDLYYRLSIINLHVPPLRERKTDIEPLLIHFLTKFNKQFKKKVCTPSKALMARLLSYKWPGNVRELNNAVERSILLADDNHMKLEDLIPQSAKRKLDKDSRKMSSFENMPSNYIEAKSIFEKSYIKSLLLTSKGNIAEASRISGQYRPVIYRLLKKHGLNSQYFI